MPPENIILIGMPGSGKTTFGKILAQKTEKSFIDFDDDILEEKYNDSVGNILDSLGEKKFLELEESAIQDVLLKNTVFSTSGSVPYSPIAMSCLKEQGPVVYLKVEKSEILKRFHKMKTERIIGLGEKTFEEIFLERENLYKKYADIVFEYSGKNLDSISSKLLAEILHFDTIKR